MRGHRPSLVDGELIVLCGFSEIVSTPAASVGVLLSFINYNLYVIFKMTRIQGVRNKIVYIYER
ncbi:hypothetical protein BOSEA1005_11373 [Hyphomicrobiales bacterium]|nr:hypothetical protein BOSEA1005_11373 [Hyphomicrobiales bacterium]CAI0341980.1 hypothetical protein BO1005MUT1_120006 [Hyphomicrobiales bacterium]